jgi:sugar phosphate isomerase/epimerase
MTPPLTPMIRGFALCNEVLRHLSWPEQCELIVEMGYTGVELAPFTFAESVTDLDGAARREIARVATDAGLTITGLHWLLASPPGLRLTAMEIEQRLQAEDHTSLLQHREVGPETLVRVHDPMLTGDIRRETPLLRRT